VSANSFKALKEVEARERMASLRRARKSPRAAQAEQRAVAVLNGSRGRITNLRQVLTAMADDAG